jgi:hypothetical protein
MLVKYMNEHANKEIMHYQINEILDLINERGKVEIAIHKNHIDILELKKY